MRDQSKMTAIMPLNTNIEPYTNNNNENFLNSGGGTAMSSSTIKNANTV